MGTLTDQMQNLATDIVGSHAERKAWLGALRQEAGDMQKEHRARMDTLREEVGAIREAAQDMLSEHRARMDVLREEVGAIREAAADMLKEHRSWLAGLRDEVAEMLKEFRTDQEGARRAWQEMASSPGPQPSKPALTRTKSRTKRKK